MEICTIGGYTRTGGNSVAIKVGEEVVILDMGLSMENYIRYTEDREDISAKSYKELLKAGAVPDYNFISDWKEKVLAIVPSHAHLDHCGAIPFAASLFPKVPIICTPYTIEVLKGTLEDDNIEIPNQFISLSANSRYKLSENIMLEFVHVTHSIPQTVLVVLHTPEGKVLYANDYKFDREPTLGKAPNFERLEELGKEGVAVLIVECLYAEEHRKMPSESVARQLLKEVMLGTNSEGKALIATTFSSHIARLKSIIEMGKKLNRKIVFLGRSLGKYIQAAENLEIVNFQKEAQIVDYQDKIEKILRKIAKEGKDKYLIVCTGHQGEPKAILSRMARGEYALKLGEGDIVIFSCSVIPVQLNRDNREKLENNLHSKNVRIFKDVHVSGHAAREDHRELLNLIKPQVVIPAHAGGEKAKELADLAAKMGFKKVFLMEDGKRVVVK